GAPAVGAKRRAVAVGGNPHLKNSEKLLLLVAKLGLKNAQDMRAVQATLFKTIMLKRDNVVAEAALKALKAHTDSAKEMQPEHPPAVYMWAAITRAAATVEGLEEAHNNAIINHRQQVTDPGQLKDIIYHAKTARTLDNNKVKLHLAAHASVEPVVKGNLRAGQLSGGRQMHGQAPKGGLERDIQRLFEQLGAMVADDE
ncbi:unnamed protein product, partial [Prorocentrum cordatum]